ncbi:hypothetical protein HWV62_3727 [Athelia sp. TMB]|nr:hypothetical protein HWV62_3727 [Athelia sp. TMB]
MPLTNVKPLCTETAFTGSTAGLVQLFYAWRVQVLIRSMCITAAAILGAAASASLGITVAIQGKIFPVYDGWQREFEPWVLAWLGISAVTDITLAAVLVGFLLKRKTGQEAADSLINRIVKSTVQTGALTALLAIVNVIVFVNLHSQQFSSINPFETAPPEVCIIMAS